MNPDYVRRIVQESVGPVASDVNVLQWELEKLKSAVSE